MGPVGLQKMILRKVFVFGTDNCPSSLVSVGT